MTSERLRPTVGLAMIVRDEAAIIARCLRSVRDKIDTWVICDTGSTDGTPSLVECAPGGRARRPSPH